MIACEQFAAAEPILRQWQAAAPGNIEVQKYLEAVAARREAAGAEADDLALAPLDDDRRLRLDESAPAIPPLNLFPPAAGGLPAAPFDATLRK